MNQYYYEPGKETDKYDIGYLKSIDLVERGDFHIGQSYANKPDATVICKKCGNDKFIVGQGHCHTSIKCINCEWELCIHDG